MKKVKYFNKKSTVVSFILYILITAFILISSLIEGHASGTQSDFVSNAISDVVALLSGETVNLEGDGTHNELYPESIDAWIDNDGELLIGKTYKLNYAFKPEGKYGLAKVSITSSDESVLKISSSGVIEPLVVGNSTVIVKDGFSGLKKELHLTVGNAAYTPEISLITSDDAKYYYSPENNAGALYAIDYSAPLPPIQLKAYTDKPDLADVVLAGNKVLFVPRATGEFKIYMKGIYLNVNGINYVETVKTVTVLEKELPLQNANSSLNSLDIKTDETTVVTPFLSQVFDFYVYDSSNLLTINKQDNSLSITPKSKGEGKLYVYSILGARLNVAEIPIRVTQGIPGDAEILSSKNYVHLDYGLELHVSSNGKQFARADFNWEVTGGATIIDGVVKGKKHETVTVTATHKENPNFVVSRTYAVRYNYTYYVRKIVGHFLLFTLLAIFAVVVYYRLAETLPTKHVVLTALILILTAGLITAGLSELLQLEIFTTNRTATVNDFITNIVGYIFGVIAFALARLIKSKQNKKRP